MALSAALFSQVLLWSVVILMAVVLLCAFLRAPWKALLEKPERQHAFFAAWVSLIIMMQLKIQWVDGVTLHFLMMTSIVVVFGWSLTIIIGFSAQLLIALWYMDYSLVLAVNFFLSTVVPASVAYGIFRFIVRHKSKNLFVFLLGGGFFGAIVTLMSSLTALFILLILNQQWETLAVLYDKSLMVVLLSYSEGFLNGLIVTALTVFFPGLVRTFDEQKYLDS